MEIQKQLEREEQFHQWMNVTEFILGKLSFVGFKPIFPLFAETIIPV